MGLKLATISKRKYGYCVQIRRKGFEPISQTFPTRSQAEQWARDEDRKRVSQRGKRLLLNPRKITLRELLTRYLSSVTPNKLSHESEAYRINKLLRAPICDLSLFDLTPNAIASYRDERLKEAQAATVCREIHLIKHALTIAKNEWGYDLADNVVDKVKLPRIRNARSRRVSDDEVKRIVRHLTDLSRDDVILVVRFALETAMRRGEILALEWKYVDLKRHTAHLPKTKNGHARTVPMTNLAVQLLSSMDKRQGRVFPVTSDALKMCWRRMIVSLDLIDLHFHDLRHEAISRFFEMGLSMPEVALISGHRDPRMLMRYTHLVPYQLAQKLAAM
jgi:integrase